MPFMDSRLILSLCMTKPLHAVESNFKTSQSQNIRISELCTISENFPLNKYLTFIQKNIFKNSFFYINLVCWLNVSTMCKL